MVKVESAKAGLLCKSSKILSRSSEQDMKAISVVSGEGNMLGNIGLNGSHDV